MVKLKNPIYSLTGNLLIEIAGGNIENLLNNAAKKKIRIYDLEFSKERVIGKITPKDFIKIRTAARGTKTRIKIIKKEGLIFKIKPNLHRTGFIAGLFLFLIIIKALSLFVWNIEVKGSKTVPKNEIIAYCNEIGVDLGKYRKGIDTNKTANLILLKFPKLTWASVNIEGSFVTVNVSEADKTQEYEVKPPSNLIAKADGTIDKIDTVSGETKVSVGDTVAKGDILVSGVRMLKGSTTFIESKGEVYANTVRTYTETKPYKQKVLKTYGIRDKKVLTFFFFKTPLYLGTTKGIYIGKTKTENLNLFGKDMPISIITKRQVLKKYVTEKYSEKELLAQIDKSIENRIKSDGINKYTETKREVIKSEKDIKIIKEITAYENIAREQKINIDKK
ncbi:MAG: sporulation protein YqfD [Clostridia bacterium]|nr:sporulation protein YqfD [Clostridia bacterium]